MASRTICKYLLLKALNFGRSGGLEDETSDRGGDHAEDSAIKETILSEPGEVG